LALALVVVVEEEEEEDDDDDDVILAVLILAFVILAFVILAFFGKRLNFDFEFGVKSSPLLSPPDTTSLGFG
jgi:hypothetical protein